VLPSGRFFVAGRDVYPEIVDVWLQIGLAPKAPSAPVPNSNETVAPASVAIVQPGIKPADGAAPGSAPAGGSAHGAAPKSAVSSGRSAEPQPPAQ
jgi:hypothetical protein